ncbi:MAG: hypothetical protein AAFY64_11740, partial [Pseudomonadota bacterium]
RGAGDGQWSYALTVSDEKCLRVLSAGSSLTVSSMTALYRLAVCAEINQFDFAALKLTHVMRDSWCSNVRRRPNQASWLRPCRGRREGGSGCLTGFMIVRDHFAGAVTLSRQSPDRGLTRKTVASARLECTLSSLRSSG